MGLGSAGRVVEASLTRARARARATPPKESTFRALGGIIKSLPLSAFRGRYLRELAPATTPRPRVSAVHRWVSAGQGGCREQGAWGGALVFCHASVRGGGRVGVGVGVRGRVYFCRASVEKEKTIGLAERYASPVVKSHARILVSAASLSKVPGALGRSRWRKVKGRCSPAEPASSASCGEYSHGKYLRCHPLAAPQLLHA